MSDNASEPKFSLSSSVASMDADGAAPRVHAGGAIYGRVRQMILDGRILPDTPVSQAWLARELGVSRTPVREALRQLQQEGLVDAEAGRRFQVIGLRPKEIEIVYASRVLNESLALAVSAPQFTGDELERIAGRLAAMRLAVRDGDYPTWEREHDLFHHLLACHASEELRHQIKPYYERTTMYRRLNESPLNRDWNVGDASHAAILAACQAHEHRRAVNELAQHLTTIGLSVLGRVRPQYEPAALRHALLLVTEA